MPIELLLKDCVFHRTRRSGPGGQHRNKVETAVVVEHLPSHLRAEASERRSQALNRETAIQRLRVQLALQVRTPLTEVSDKWLPSQLWISRTAAGRISVSTSHQDFAALLSEALDLLASLNYQIPLAASRLGITNSQLVKFLKLEPQAILSVNQHRENLGLSELK